VEEIEDVKFTSP